MLHLEDKLQAQCFQWFWNEHPKFRKLYFKIKNDGSKSQFQAAIDRATGLIAGIPDSCLAYPNGKYPSLFIEFKIDKGTFTQSQKEVFPILEAVGNKIITVRTFEEFKEKVIAYINGGL